MVHVDYTTKSGFERIDALLPQEEADRLKKTPFAAVQVRHSSGLKFLLCLCVACDFSASWTHCGSALHTHIACCIARNWVLQVVFMEQLMSCRLVSTTCRLARFQESLKDIGNVLKYVFLGLTPMVFACKHALS